MDINLLHKYISGDATDIERLEVAEWLDADKANMKKYIELRRVHDASVWVEEPQDVNRSAIFKRSTKKRMILQFGKVASIAVLILFSTYLVYKQYNKGESASSQMLTMITPAGQYGQLVLADGSHVWLNSQSRLEFPSKFDSNSREVFLDGEAFFEVAADKDSPFTVHTKDYSVIALGTEFNVRSFSESEESTTSLLSGHVNVKMNNSEKTYSLAPNQQLDFEEGSASLTPIPSLSYFDWKYGVMSFENETMRELLNKLSHYYAVEIDVRNEKILNDKYTGKFKVNDGIEQALKVLQLRSNFGYKKKGDYILIENK